MIVPVTHLTTAELDAGLPRIRLSPREEGVLELIVRRPATDEREVADQAKLDAETGLVGDTWSVRGSSRTDDGAPHPDTQLTLMNARAIDLIAQDKRRWPLAGDQLYVDMDLSTKSLPAGT